MNLSQKIGQLLIVGFHGTTPDDPWVQKIGQQIKEGKVGGVILFSYNIENPKQLKALTQYLKSCAQDYPLFISVDQEGGAIQRLSPKQGFKKYLSPADVAKGSFEEAQSHYCEMGRELQEHGINLDFAPCVDTNPNGYSCPVIGGLHRSFSNTPEKVTHYASAALKGFLDASVLPVIKHFPGHGSAQGDSHAGFVDVSHVWHERELQPFYDLVENHDVPMVMTAHIFNEQLDEIYPATLSKKTLSLLRAKGYEGIIISDDVHMGAIQQEHCVKEASCLALQAGCDMLILSNNKAAAMGVPFTPTPDSTEHLLNHLEEKVNQDTLCLSRINESLERVLDLKKRL